MKKITLSLVFCTICTLNYAQTARRQSEMPYSGSFYVVANTAKGQEQINVNYSLSTPPFVNSVNMQMNTPDPMMMMVKILNLNSETVMNWMPSQKSNRYGHSFDISNLSAGTYKMEIYGPDSKIAKTINFQKQAETSQIHSGN